MFKENFKRSISIFLVIMLAFLCSLSGCAKEDDESLTAMIPLQKECFKRFFDLFGESNPDIEFELSAYRGGSPSAYILNCFEANDLTDIVITSYPPEGTIQEETLLDLSGYNFVQNYKASVLSNLDVNGSIYLLECPSSVRGIAYNKTMFAENGWEVPTSHEEFMALIKEIKESNVVEVPLGIQGKYPGTYFTIMSELSHCDFLQTPNGALWMQKFANGEVSSEEGFSSGISLLEDWREAGAFDSSQLTLGDSTLYKKFVEEKWCAMSYIMGSQNKLVELTENSDDEFGVFPIYGRGEDSEFIATTYGLKVGINKKLGEPGNEEKLKKALKLMEFLSTEEGQMVFHTGRGDLLPLIGTDSTLSPLFDEISGVIERGHCAPFLYPGYEDILPITGEYLRDACYNEDALAGAFDVMDTFRANSLANKSNYVATVSETLNEDQVAQYVANALHSLGYGDFALVSQGRYSEYFDVAGGANGKLHKGGVSVMATNLPLTNLAAQDTVAMQLSGADVVKLLKTGRVLKDDAGHEDAYVYYSAGIDVKRDKDGSIKEVLFNGSPLEDDHIYTVVFSPQDYSSETAEIGNPQNTGTPWEDDYLEYIKTLGTIKPEHAVKSN